MTAVAVAEHALAESLETEALARGLLSVDSARRVGWAKAFDALRRVDSLEEETRQLRDEQKYLRRAYSRLVGLAHHAGVHSPAWDEEIRMHTAAEQTFRMDGAYREGASVGNAHLAFHQGMDPELRAARISARGAVFAAMHRTLKALAYAEGHRAVIRRRQDHIVVSCPCGEQARFAADQDREARDWRLYHWAWSATGAPFEAFKDEWKRAHDDALRKDMTLDECRLVECAFREIRKTIRWTP